MSEDPKTLQAEVTDIKKTLAKHNRFDGIVKTVTALIALVAIVAGFIQYRVTTENEFRKTFWQQQLEVYKRTTQAAAGIALSTESPPSPSDRATFWRLYWGELSVLEHPVVKDAMVAYGNQLYEVEAGRAAPSTLRQLSFKLARACRLSLQQTWNPADLGDIRETLPEK